MIKSMTGYGRAREVRNKRDITVEVRSVNNRYLDCTVKMPRMYSFAEDAVKQCVQKAISRGKVDVFITVDASAADVAKVTVNRELAAQYAAALAELSEVCGTESKVTPEQLSRFPDVLTVTKEDEDLETVSADLCAVAEQALEAYNAMRAVEGRKLAEDIGNRLTYIENYTSQVEQRSPETVTEYRAKLTDLDTTGDFLLASVRPAPVRVGKTEDAVETEALLRALKSSFDEYLGMNPRLAKDVVFTITTSTDPVFLSEYIPANLLFRFEDKQAILDEGTLLGRLKLLIEKMHRERRMLEIDKEIAQKVDEAMDKNQRDY